MEGPKLFSEGGSNPNMPGTIHGLKWDDTEGTTSTFWLVSDREPVWGDLYAKGGRAGGQGWNALWNEGLGDPDNDPGVEEVLLLDGADYTGLGHVLVPDSTTTTHNQTGEEVPELLTVFGVGLGVIAAGAAGRRRLNSNA